MEIHLTQADWNRLNRIAALRKWHKDDTVSEKVAKAIAIAWVTAEANPTK